MSAAATNEALEELAALAVHVLSPHEERSGWTVLHAAIVDRWATGRGLEHIVIVADVRAPDGWTAKRAGLVFSSGGGRKPFFMWLRGEDTIRRGAEGLLAALRA